MAISITKAGPYYASGAISFGSLRSNFRAQNVDGSFNTDTLPIKASELIRVTSQTVTNPTVPDATENGNIPSSVGAGSSIKASHFRNSIKYFYITQSGTNDNSGNSSVPGLSLSSTDWNSNLNKNIRKNLIISGIVGSSYNNQPAFSFSDSMCNLIISVTGGIYGAGGVLATNSGIGGNAMYVNNTFSSSPVIISIDSGSAQIYGGGGVGGTGGTGGTGGIGGGAGTYTQNLLPRSPIPSGGSGGPGGSGGAGGNGRGYNNSNITGSPGGGGSGGSVGSAYGSPYQFRYPQYSGLGNGILNWYSGNGGTGGPGGNGGNGGDWATGGDPGTGGGPGTDGTPSTGGIFLAVRNYTPDVTFYGLSQAGHTNCIFIRNMIEFCLGGEGTETYVDQYVVIGYVYNEETGQDDPIYELQTVGGYVSLGARDAGLYGPVEMYDASIGYNPDGIYLTGQATFLADDNGASGDDANDLQIYFDPQGDNIYGTYTPLYGTGGTGGTGGAAGAAGGAAITGSNYSLSGIVNTNTIKG
jgi:hypothetical protein